MNDRPEPVMNYATVATAIIVLVKAAVAMATVMGWIEWDTTQRAAVNAFVVALIDGAIILWSMWQARSLVTPTADPRDEHGNSLLREDWE